AQQRNAGLQEPLAVPRDGEHHPGERQRQTDAQDHARENSVAWVRRQQRTQHFEQCHRSGHQPQQKERRRQLRRRFAPKGNIQECFSESQHRSFSHNRIFKLYTRNEGMPDAIWVDRNDELPALARRLESQPLIGVDTEFLRERTFFPKLCLLQIAAGGEIWCVDTLRGGSLDHLVPAMTAVHTRKVIHSARQDLEAFYLTTKRVISPVFDTQIAAGCIGLKPQVGYAELVKT